MYKKTITYTDYNGNERTEDFYFNLTKAEIADMQFSTEGGLGEYIQKIVAAKSTVEISKLFKDLIFRSYGEKSPDGRRFIKSAELSEEFSQTEAYSEFYIMLASDEKEAAAFFNGIIPSDLKKTEA